MRSEQGKASKESIQGQPPLRTNHTHARTATTSMLLRTLVLLLAVWRAPPHLVNAFAPPSPVATRFGNTRLFATAVTGPTLYGHPGTRSPLIHWAALELGVALTMAVDLRENPHPFGQLPCLADANEVVVFESGAILHYLQQHYAAGTTTTAVLLAKDAAAVSSWITWANASLDPICFLETPDGKVYDTGLRRPNKRMDRLNELLGSGDWLVGENTLTLADVAVASYLLYVYQFIPDIRLSEKWPNLPPYLARSVQRPAYAQAFGKPTQARLLAQLEKDMEGSQKLFGMF
jgi:glutathione S-transferase